MVFRRLHTHHSYFSYKQEVHSSAPGVHVCINPAEGPLSAPLCKEEHEHCQSPTK